MRLFIAINFDEEIKNALVGVQNGWRRARITGNYSKSENLHLTLAFIGEYGDPERVLQTLEEMRFTPFELSLDRVGLFDGLWWAGVSSGGKLNALAAQVRKLLANAGIPFDRKKFSPHITMIREPSAVIPPAILLPAASMTVTRVSLMRSERGKHGMIYTEIGGVNASVRS